MPTLLKTIIIPPLTPYECQNTHYLFYLNVVYNNTIDSVINNWNKKILPPLCPRCLDT